MDKQIKEPEVLVIGAGPAGLTAGIYAARSKLDTLILEDELVGGQIRDARFIENFPGFNRISGVELADHMREQSISAGVELDEFDSILSLNLTDDEKIIETARFIYRPQALIIAAGMRRKKLPIPEEKQFHGNGIHYCELCDGHLYEGKEIAVIGGGGAAVGAAIALTKFATKVTIIHRSNSFRADKKDQDALFNNPKIEVIWSTKVVGAVGDKILHALVLEMADSSRRKITVDGAFVYIGSSPRTEMYVRDLKLDSYGNIIAGESCETNIPGVFVAGDVRTKSVRQLTTAVSDGTVAAIMAEQYINNLRRGKLYGKSVYN
ncbi:thioredoxin reductase (NADPH) [Sporomusaceae bacterium BoRhaA]|uniref:NAD(P)/FAD-dependent oxidoreductase n=1 Tax=Pelorhabdus rhamnosifermentans TaxID=2772457 RepID=UPI001C05FF30|nr:FAD-dependent oxidoreductase [Pelorhabdus rhamnosifermentans]MBU2700072.1 thioredoxin reductase (NADPH) [Pelorhabdus rhamnosifermentans]